MMSAVSRRLLLLLALMAAPGCSIGSDDGSPPTTTPTSARSRSMPARGEGSTRDSTARMRSSSAPDTGPRVVFFLTAGEAEAAQFEGEGEGAEQIGSALLYVREGTDDLLEEVEACLGEL